MSRLTRRFYLQDTETVARSLLGCRLVHVVDGQRLSGIITETEAYLGIGDPACHTFGGRRSPRNSSMYLEGGHAYVYFTYGMHFCFNVVTRSPQDPEAVLVRAILPEEGLETMILHRGAKSTKLRTLAANLPRAKLTDGPAKLCQALSIGRSCDGLSLLGDELFIEKATSSLDKKIITASPRVGVDYAKDAALWPLRFRLSE
jgi:DNA-3-methyladenine glycosylase